jgi:hypothetical protein
VDEKSTSELIKTILNCSLVDEKSTPELIKTILNCSLVDEKSTPEHILEHWHKLVDCRKGPLCTDWQITKVCLI